MSVRASCALLIAAAGLNACTAEPRQFSGGGGGGSGGGGVAASADSATSGSASVSAGVGGSGGEAPLVPPDGMVAVPAGAFSMGCHEPADTNCSADEYPYHEVTLKAFAIDQTEVTVASYSECVALGVCNAPNPLPGTECNYGNQDRKEHPINCVTWEDATKYCGYVDKRLPTEAEWEKAARGVDGRIYPWGDEAPTCVRVTMSGCGTGTTPVGLKPGGASPYDALDMAGNVHEWVSDWYKAAYYLESPQEDPTGPSTGTLHGLRGGASNYGEAGMRTSFRVVDIEGNPAHGGVGFRCALSL